MPDENSNNAPDTVMNCSYPGCRRFALARFQNKYCNFHSPVKDKRIDIPQFYEEIMKIINEAGHNQRPCNFEGFIFPGDITLSRRNFNAQVNFKKAEFAGKVNFSDTIFSEKVSFEEAQFRKKANFEKVKFSGTADFNSAHFRDLAIFQNVQFQRNELFPITRFEGSADFGNSKFDANVIFAFAKFEYKVSFLNAKILGKAHFEEVEFGQDAIFGLWKENDNTLLNEEPSEFNDESYFNNAKFIGNASFRSVKFAKKPDFTGTVFKKIADFSRSKLCNGALFNLSEFYDMIFFTTMTIGGDIDFVKIRLGENADFLFQRNNFIFAFKAGEKIRIIFDSVKFRPFNAKFENVRISEENKQNQLYMLFRYCDLTDIFFVDNEMYWFSFLTSSFDKARITSSEWGETHDGRKNVLPEEVFFDQLLNNKDFNDKKSQFREYRQIYNLVSRSEVEALYRRMKSA